MIKYYRFAGNHYKLFEDNSYMCVWDNENGYGHTYTPIGLSYVHTMLDTEITESEFNAVLNSVKEKINQL